MDTVVETRRVVTKTCFRMRLSRKQFNKQQLMRERKRAKRSVTQQRRHARAGKRDGNFTVENHHLKDADIEWPGEMPEADIEECTCEICDYLEYWG